MAPSPIKAIIPVAGAGTRLRPLTYTQPKPLIPVAGKPIISFIIDQLLSVGVEEFVFIIGYLGEKIREYVNQAYPELNATFVEQVERLGSAHAIWLASDAWREAEKVVVFFGDVLIDAPLSNIIHHPNSCLAVKRVDDPRQFGVVELDDDGSPSTVRRVVEKPKIPKSDLAMVGVYALREVGAFYDALTFNITRQISTHGEYPLTDVLMRMIEQGIRFSTLTVDNWFDCGQKSVLLDTNAIFLDRVGYATEDPGPYDNTILIHPVSIGKNCQISHAIIGPHVTIGNNVHVSNAIVKDSIIGNYTSIREVILHRSIVGNDTSITGIKQSLNIGDNTEIDFGSAT